MSELTCEYCDRRELHTMQTCTKSKKTAESDFGGTLNSSHAFTQAETTGEVVVLPKANELFIDIDDEAASTRFYDNVAKVHEYVGVLDQRHRPSRSGDPNRWHITVDLARSVNDMERILLQAVLGSDLRRELLSYCRITIGDPHPTLFLEKGPTLIGPGQALAIINSEEASCSIS